MTWYHPALAKEALAESDAEIKQLRAENERLRADRDEWKSRAVIGDDWRRQADADREGLEAENERLRAVISDAAEAIDKGSSSAPVAESLWTAIGGSDEQKETS